MERGDLLFISQIGSFLVISLSRKDVMNWNLLRVYLRQCTLWKWYFFAEVSKNALKTSKIQTQKLIFISGSNSGLSHSLQICENILWKYQLSSTSKENPFKKSCTSSIFQFSWTLVEIYAQNWYHVHFITHENLPELLSNLKSFESTQHM